MEDWSTPLDPRLEQALIVLGGVLRDIASNPSPANTSETSIPSARASTSLDHPMITKGASPRSHHSADPSKT